MAHPEKEFLRRLERSAPDLAETVADIRLAKREHALYQQFRLAPKERDPEGNLRFTLPAPEDPSVNLLEVFDSVKEAEEYAGGFYDLREASTGIRLAPEYLGPKITLLPDTNIEMSPWYASFMASLTRNGAIKREVITLVAQETQPGGLHRRHGRAFKEDLLRAQQSLIRRCPGMTSSQKSSATALYDVLTKYFGEEASQVYRLADKFPRESHEDIAARFLEKKEANYDLEAYLRMITKMVEAYRANRPNNMVVDRVLTATGYGMNLIRSRYQPAVVVSNDKDLTSVFDAFHEEILPRYMARVAIQAILARNPLFARLPGYEARSVEAAREQIAWAADNFPQSATVGILYNPQQQQVYTRQVAAPFKEFFANATDYLHGKSQVIERMVMLGVSAEQAISSLIGRNRQHSEVEVLSS